MSAPTPPANTRTVYRFAFRGQHMPREAPRLFADRHLAHRTREQFRRMGLQVSHVVPVRVRAGRKLDDDKYRGSAATAPCSLALTY